MTKKILVVEDNEIAQKAAIEILQSSDFQIDIAENGQRALTLVQENHYALVLMDIGLPDIDGITVAEAIREMTPIIGYIPIVALTAHADNTIEEECRRNGIDEFLVKPLDRTTAMRVIKDFVGKKAPEPELTD